MLTATLRKDGVVVAQVSSCDQARLDKALEPFLLDGAEVEEQTGEPEPEGHDAPEEPPAE